jgi:ankyrin repeat protein
MLVSRGATLDPKEWTEIMNNAITGGHMPMIRAILESHLIVDNGSDVFGEEALEYAARLGTPSVANAMLDLETFSSEISLCRAARMGRLFTTELLLRRGAAVDERNDIGSTPLVQAVMEGHQPIVEMLLEWGAVVDAEDLALWTALETNRSEDVAIAQLLRDRVRQ